MNRTNKKAKTFTEFILGIPGDSKEKHFKSLKHGVDNKVNTIRMFQAILLSGTEMASPETRKKFELTTKYRVIEYFTKVKGLGEDSVYVAGENGTVLRHDGKQWHDMSL